jgi:thymidylate synthase (FAD)
MAKWIQPYATIDDEIDAKAIIQKIERACRTCYRSEDKIEEGSAERLIRSCIKRGHHSILEHGSVTFRIVCDRGVSHEIVRHRLASYSQESTRYCNYSHEKFGNELTFIYPSWVPETRNEQSTNVKWLLMQEACDYIEKKYFGMLTHGAKPEEARAILPNCLRTELVMTMNIRELRHFLKLRLSKAAHPDIRVIAAQMLEILKVIGLGIFFEDIEVE